MHYSPSLSSPLFFCPTVLEPSEWQRMMQLNNWDPVSLRDQRYLFLARNRYYLWLGRKGSCS